MGGSALGFGFPSSSSSLSTGAAASPSPPASHAGFTFRRRAFFRCAILSLDTTPGPWETTPPLPPPLLYTGAALVTAGAFKAREGKESGQEAGRSGPDLAVREEEEEEGATVGRLPPLPPVEEKEEGEGRGASTGPRLEGAEWGTGG